MTAGELLDQLRELEVVVSADGERLLVNAPRGQLTDELKKAIADHKAELLRLLSSPSPGRDTDIPALEQGSEMPLSSFQERLWILHRLDPDSTAFNMATVWRIADPANVEEFRHVIRGVVERHQILRSTFRDDDAGVPQIHVLESDAVHIQAHDLRGQTEIEQHALIDAASQEWLHTPFNLAVEAPIRFQLYQLAPGQIAILVVGHHIALDAFSLGLLRREIESRNNLSADPSAQAAPLQYAQYAAWQRREQNVAAIGPELNGGNGA